MRYTFIAATIAGMAAVGAAQATPSVRMYGIIDTTYEFANGKHVIYQNPTNTTTTISTRNNHFRGGGLSSSRLGFKGEEPLGNGLSATFAMEMRFDSATGAWKSHKTSKGETVTGFAARTLVGLKGKYGHFSIGRENTPIDNNIFPIDIAGHTRSDVPLTGKVEGLFYNGKFGGLGIEAFAGRNRSTTTQDGVRTEDHVSESGYGIALRYDAGPFAIAGVAQQFRPGKITRDNSNRITGDTRTRTDEFGLAASYKLGDVRFVSNYIYAKTAPRHSNAYSRWEHLNLGVEYKTGPVMLVAEVGRNRARAVNNTAKLGSYGKLVTSNFPGDFHLKGAGTNFVVGANYIFSKRTDLYIRAGRKQALNSTIYDAAGNQRGTLKGRTNYVFAGIRHRF